MENYYFWGGLWAKLTPLVMFPFRPSTAALSRVFSFSSRLASGLRAFSAPEVCERCQRCYGGLYPYIRISIRVTHAELDGHGEEVAASLLGDGVTAFNAWQVDV